jgi:prostaglandin-H2 D-isomerase / glutathione transferase
VLTVDGQVFAESQAILRYAGRVAGLYPTGDAIATLLVDEIITAIDEIRELHLTPTRRETDREKQRLLREALVAGPLPVALARLDARVQTVASYPFFQEASSSKIYLHEVSVWGFLTIFKQGRFDYIPTTVADAYETLNAIHAKVDAAIARLPATASPPVSPSTIQRPEKLTLTYFDIPGRAEPIRLALHIGGLSFHDERLKRDAFLARKPTLPYGQVPVLTVDSVTAAQSFALLRYAGSLSGLYPLNHPTELLKVDEIIARVEDVYYALAPSNAEKDQEKKRAMREQLAADRLPLLFALLDKRVAQWRQTAPFVLGHGISIADLAILSLVQFCKSGFVDFVPATIIDQYEHLIEVHDEVLKHERVVDWYATATK